MTSKLLNSLNSYLPFLYIPGFERAKSPECLNVDDSSYSNHQIYDETAVNARKKLYGPDDLIWMVNSSQLRAIIDPFGFLCQCEGLLGRRLSALLG